MGLTAPQARALRAIADFHSQNGRVPSYRELAEALGHSATSAAFRVVLLLIERGHLTGFPGGYALARLATQPMRFIEAGTREPGAPEAYLGRYPIRSHRTLAELWAEDEVAAQAKPGGMAPKATLARACPSAAGGRHQ